MRLKKLTVLAFFTTLSLIIYTVESAIPPLVPIPGLKLGLSNIITLILLRNFSVKDTVLVQLTRIFLASFLFGHAMSLIYSLAGGCLSLLVMVFVNAFLKQRYLFITSCFGGIFHNIGQLFAAFCLTCTAGVLAYLPFLILSGILTGLFTGLCAYFSQISLIPAIRKAVGTWFLKEPDDAD